MLRPLPKRLGRLLSRTMSHCEADPRAFRKRVLVAGLGNYGLRGTRHNVGMAVLNQLAQKLNVADQWKVDRHCCADVTITNVEEAELVLMKPRRLMNINGLSVASAAETYNLGVEDIYLVHDDLDKPLGKMAIKLGGSARGHNGVRSCISSLYSDCMVRLRVGIGRPVGEAMVDHYVLGQFASAEREVLQRVLEQAADLLLEHILQRSSGKDLTPPGDKGDRTPH
ncbi:probable peptidyl-tRNA hydrolase isoform X2 [Dermochelys coriacea]|uniref:probable peptidyl-tRNA hydrolase isoform X2 n=1 Tax=Dermochelys coriacea TaxID=27794 RepID=UPI0018E76C55|nr:probable peptidyl-tRNA hydrolase isoform X2 [Dermochelys coriacea]